MLLELLNIPLKPLPFIVIFEITLLLLLGLIPSDSFKKKKVLLELLNIPLNRSPLL